MKRWLTALVVASLAVGLAVFQASPALASSSGSFTASVDSEACTINGGSGKLSNPLSSAIYLTPSSGLQVQVPSNTDIVISPSLVTGIYTDNQITNKNSSSLQNDGVFVQVTVEPTFDLGGDKVSISPNTTATGGTGTTSQCNLPTDAPAGSATSCAIYDQRFIEVSSSVISSLAGCSAIATASDNVCFDLTESTLSAHDFNWYANLPDSGTYTVTVTAALVDPGSTLSSGSSAACAGPGTVTLTQVKNFSQNSPAQF